MTDTQEPVAGEIKTGETANASMLAGLERETASVCESADVSSQTEPLYTQDQLDAAVRAERERCAVIAETCDGPYSAPTDEQDRAAADMGDRIAAAIREGK